MHIYMHACLHMYGCLLHLHLDLQGKTNKEINHVYTVSYFFKSFIFIALQSYNFGGFPPMLIPLDTMHCPPSVPSQYCID